MAKDDDPFDEIVRHLDIDLPFPEPARPERAPKERAPAEPADDDPFYRRVPPAAPWHPKVGILLAWAGVIGSPLTITVASMVRYILPRPMLLGIALLFVASAVYLIAQLPERGPGEPHWPDDGAQL